MYYVIMIIKIVIRVVWASYIHKIIFDDVKRFFIIKNADVQLVL